MQLTGSVLFLICTSSTLVSSQSFDGVSDEGESLDFQDKGEEVDKRLQALNTDNSNEIKANESYRCGVFYAAGPNEKPLKSLFVVPRRFSFDCTKPQAEIHKSVKKECYDLVSVFKDSSQ